MTAAARRDAAAAARREGIGGDGTVECQRCGRRLLDPALSGRVVGAEIADVAPDDEQLSDDGGAGWICPGRCLP